jgi:hypothetical protein
VTRVALQIITDPADLDGGPFIAEFDVNADGGRGRVTFTRDPKRAATWGSTGEALAAYGQTSTVRPLRPDGKPNRPLTAYTVLLAHLDDGGRS